MPEWARAWARELTNWREKAAIRTTVSQRSAGRSRDRPRESGGMPVCECIFLDLFGRIGRATARIRFEAESWFDGFSLTRISPHSFLTARFGKPLGMRLPCGDGRTRLDPSLSSVLANRGESVAESVAKASQKYRNQGRPSPPRQITMSTPPGGRRHSVLSLRLCSGQVFRVFHGSQSMEVALLRFG